MLTFSQLDLSPDVNATHFMQTPAIIRCCLCARPTASDEAVEGRCLQCLSSTVDLTEGIENNCEIEMCNACAQSV